MAAWRCTEGFLINGVLVMESCVTSCVCGVCSILSEMDGLLYYGVGKKRLASEKPCASTPSYEFKSVVC